MSFGTTLLLIVIVGIAYSIWKQKHEASQGIVRDRRGDPLPGARDKGEAEHLRGEMERLRERIAVLERIATDDAGPRRLSAEIESLRQLQEDEEGVSDDRK